MQGTYFYIVMMEEKEEEMHFLCPAICFLDTYCTFDLEYLVGH